MCIVEYGGVGEGWRACRIEHNLARGGYCWVISDSSSDRSLPASYPKSHMCTISSSMSHGALLLARLHVWCSLPPHSSFVLSFHILPPILSQAKAYLPYSAAIHPPKRKLYISLPTNLLLYQH